MYEVPPQLPKILHNTHITPIIPLRQPNVFPRPHRYEFRMEQFGLVQVWTDERGTYEAEVELVEAAEGGEFLGTGPDGDA
jgi:hypothetical protein